MTWQKIKWYVYGALFVVALVVVWFLTRGDDKADLRRSLNKWVNDKRSAIVKEQIEKIKVKEKLTDKEIEKVEQKLDEIEKKRKANGEERYDDKSMQELADLYKELG